MAAVARIISDVVMKEAPEMALVQNHHAIQQLPAAASDPALGDAVLPGTPRCDPLRLDAHRLDRRDHVLREDRVHGRTPDRTVRCRTGTIREAAGSPRARSGAP